MDIMDSMAPSIIIAYTIYTANQSWRVSYLNAAKKRAFWSKGLAVAPASTAAERDAERTQKLSWARVLWNMLDKSDKARYPMSTDDEAHIRAALRTANVFLG